MFDFLVRELADTHPSPPLDDLRDFVIDAEYAFKQPAGFDVVTVTTTDNPCSRLGSQASLSTSLPGLGAYCIARYSWFGANLRLATSRRPLATITPRRRSSAL